MLLYIDAALISYMLKERVKLGLPDISYDLCIRDVSAAYMCDFVTMKLKDNSIKVFIIPTSYTGQLQPLHVAVKKPFKVHLKQLHVFCK